MLGDVHGYRVRDHHGGHRDRRDHHGDLVWVVVSLRAILRTKGEQERDYHILDQKGCA